MSKAAVAADIIQQQQQQKWKQNKKLREKKMLVCSVKCSVRAHLSKVKLLDISFD